MRGIVARRRARDWPWSSARAHVEGRGDALIAPAGPLTAEVTDWRAFLAVEAVLERLRRHGRTGGPLGSLSFLRWLQRRLDRLLVPGPRLAGRARRRENSIVSLDNKGGWPYD